MIDCQTGIVLHKYKAPGEVSARACSCRVAGRALTPGGGSVVLGVQARPPMHQVTFSLLLGLSFPAYPACLCTHAALPLGDHAPSPPKEFFSVAWTALMVVTQAGHKKRWSVLAAAGLRGLVRLLHVRAGFCCGVIRAHKKAIATLCFSPTHETHLFSKTLSPSPRGSPAPPSCSPMPQCSLGWWELMWLVGLTLGCEIGSVCGGTNVASRTTDWASDPTFPPALWPWSFPAS